MAATRRRILRLGAALAAVGPMQPVPAQAATTGAVLGDDGLYRQPWFHDSFLDLGEDLQEAAASGRRLAVIWEQKGCPFCRDMHLVNFADPRVADYVKQRFLVVQLDLLGAREVVDLDGTPHEERVLARQSAVLVTPTIQFAPERADPGRPLHASEVARMRGYLEPREFLLMFRYVAERGYEAAPFLTWAKTAAEDG